MLLNTDVRKAEVLLINEIKLLIKFGITILAIKTIKQINSISVAIIDKPLFFRYKKLVFVQYFVICFSISFIG